jgi:tetratricopeptide (TPR) repeat protein
MGPEAETRQALLSHLREHLGYRRIEQGLELLERSKPLLEDLQPEWLYSGVLVGIVAQWVDAGFDGRNLLCCLLARFPQLSRGLLPLRDYLHIRMAEGALAMGAEDLEHAEGHFQFVQSLEREVDDAELFAIANFWMGRCLRRTGRYDDALNYILRGEELALSCGYSHMAAIMQATRSWLAFQKGKLHEALAILGRAEDALSATADFLSRGNVQSAYGRIARRQGRYERAVACFELAIEEYRRGPRAQLQLARALSNLAFVKRLLALGRQKELDRLSTSRRAGKEDTTPTGSRTRQEMRSIECAREEARAHLSEAMAVYSRHGNHHGIAGVHINRGFLFLDSGDLDCAAAEAAQAFHQGEVKTDYIAMSRARMLQCVVENAAIDEQLAYPARHHQDAEAFAEDAVNYAARTQDRRLRARTLVWKGLTSAAEPYRDVERARECYEQAIALIEPEAAEKLWDDLEKLKAIVLRARPVDTTLRAWSTGLIGDQSFQQMTDEFARIVIPKVWEREGRKVSRVAERLSMSPKKVRRILHSAGLLLHGAKEPGSGAER